MTSPFRARIGSDNEEEFGRRGVFQIGVLEPLGPTFHLNGPPIYTPHNWKSIGRQERVPVRPSDVKHSFWASGLKEGQR